MNNKSFWTIEQVTKIAVAGIIALLVGIAVVAYWGGHTMSTSSHAMAAAYHDTRAFFAFSEAVRDVEDAQTEYVAGGEDGALARYYERTKKARRLRDGVDDFLKNRNQDKKLSEAHEKLDKILTQLDEIVELRKREGIEAARKRQASVDADRMLEEVDADIEAAAQALHARSTGVGEHAGERFRNWVLLGLALLLLYEVGASIVVLRYIDKNMGAVLTQVQSSTVELHAAAAEQVSGAKEQVTAASEVSTTIKELLSTSKQIAESAQKVTKIAVETAGSAKVGDQTVQKAQDAIDTVRHQVDVIVNHMLDLGRKSQEIGGILDIINELSEQTNILAINATIESAGAGEAGRRFAVVADEIRKLADRVSGSTKEIRSLIEEIRAAANTTVMATEDGSKAVDAGTKQFTEVAVAFKQIVDLVGSTALASREIELSTKQQSTAVEQVNAAISEVARTARETEASLNQTLQTVSDLTKLSSELASMVRAKSKDA